MVKIDILDDRNLLLSEDSGYVKGKTLFHYEMVDGKIFRVKVFQKNFFHNGCRREVYTENEGVATFVILCTFYKLMSNCLDGNMEEKDKKELMKRVNWIVCDTPIQENFEEILEKSLHNEI